MKIKLNKEQILRNLNKIIHESRINEVRLNDYKEGKPKLNFMLMDLNNLSQRYNNIKNKITTYQLGDILDGTVDLIDDRDFIENIEDRINEMTSDLFNDLQNSHSEEDYVENYIDEVYYDFTELTDPIQKDIKKTLSFLNAMIDNTEY